MDDGMVAGIGTHQQLLKTCEVYREICYSQLSKEEVEQYEKNKGTVGKVLKLIGPYKYLLLLSLVFAMISVALTLYAPILIGDGVDVLIGKGQVKFPEVFAILKKLAVVIVLTCVAQWLMNLCNNRITYRVVKDVRIKAFARLQVLPLKYVDSRPQGETISRIITDVEQFSDGLLMGFSQFFTGIVTILGTLVFMLGIHVQIALVVILITPVSLFVASVYCEKRTYTMFQKQSETRAEMTSLVEEMIGNQKTVQAFGYGEEALKRFDAINRNLQTCSLKAIFFSFHHKSKHTVCQWTRVCGSWDYRRSLCDARSDFCRTAVLFSDLC